MTRYCPRCYTDKCVHVAIDNLHEYIDRIPPIEPIPDNKISYWKTVVEGLELIYILVAFLLDLSFRILCFPIYLIGLFTT
jgi:hypothetical protein